MKENVKVRIDRMLWSDRDKSYTFRLGNNKFVSLPKSIVTVEGEKRNDYCTHNDTHFVTLPLWLWEKLIRDYTEVVR
jgi:hypothetical protein